MNEKELNLINDLQTAISEQSRFLEELRYENQAIKLEFQKLKQSFIRNNKDVWKFVHDLNETVQVKEVKVKLDLVLKKFQKAANEALECIN